MRIRERPQEHGIDHAEDGCVRADAKAAVGIAKAAKPGLFLHARQP
jgi:hypothetical protein